MASVISGSSIEHVRSQIKSVETNPQCEETGPAINNLPAVRGSRETHFEGGKKKSNKS